MKVRRLISFTAFVSFIFMAFTGVVLFFSPQGRIAHWSGWRMFGLTREQYSEVHTTFMVLFLTVVIWHIVLNWKPIVNYLKDRTKKVKLSTPEFSVALILGILFFGGTLLGFFPFQQLLWASGEIKAYWERAEGSPPWGHAELSKLDRFCRGMEDFERLEHQRLVTIDCEAVLEALRESGVEVDGVAETIIDIADANSTTPQALAEIVLSVARPLERLDGETMIGDGSSPFVQPYSGLGRMTMREYAERYDADLDQILSILNERDIDLDPDVRLREEASRLGIDPEGIIEVLNQSVSGEGVVR